MSWDDGKHTKVKRVQLTFDDVIRSIEVEYEGTSLKSQPRGTVGTKSDGFTLSSDEYITEVNGYYKTTFLGEVITSLTFKTNKRTYGTYGNKTRNYFSVAAPTDNQIAGFLGSSSNALNSIDAHFAPVPPPGSTGGNTAGTGSNTGSINTAGTGFNTGSNIGGTGRSNTGGNGSNTGGTGTNTGSNTGGFNTGGTGSNTGGTGTNTGSNTGGSNTGGTGSNTGTNTGSNTGGSNTGGTGTNTGSNNGGTGSNTGGSNCGGTGNTGGSGSNNSGIGYYPGGTGTNTNDSGGTSTNTGSTGSNTDSSPQKLEAQGSKIGNQWDDGADHDGVTKIHVAAGGSGIEQIRFDYIKNGQSKEGPVHGVKGRGDSSTIVINHPDEYLVSVEGWYDDSSNIIQGIQFKTNTKTSQYFGYDISKDGKQFSLQVQDKKIIGFHGFAESHLNSLGAYFVPISSTSSSLTPPPKKVEAQGGNYGETFDDGAFDHVRKVYVGQGDSGVAYVKFEYEKDGKIETREHGKMTLLATEEFEVDSGDYITSIEVSVDRVYGYKSEIVTALVFKTFKGKTSPPFGMVTENKFELKDGEGGKLAGFHGKASDVLYALGAYFAPTTTSTTSLTPSTAKKLQARGGNGGASWDDGVFDGVRKIHVGQGNDGVAFVTFEYNKGSQAILGDGHGKQTLLGTEKFEVDYPSEYITSVEGYYDKIVGFEAEVVTSLTFKTNKRTSQPFGMTAGDHFELKEEGYKIVGFHGKAGDVVHQIGVHVVPIFTN